MKRYLLLILLSALTMLTGCRQQTPDAVDTSANAKEAAAEVQSAERRQQQAALLSDARDLYRLCNTRPQRLVHTQGAKTQRTLGKLPLGLFRSHFTSNRLKPCGAVRQSGAPLPFVVSRDYYIIALRRILR